MNNFLDFFHFMDKKGKVLALCNQLKPTVSPSDVYF